MIEVHLYGLLRKLVLESKANEESVLLVESKDRESFQEFIQRLGLDMTEMGDCFINGRLAHISDSVKDEDRVGLFPYNMRLIDGGMELKYRR
jgi:hypothetical protein